MLDAFIIERIRKQQQEQRRSEGVPLRLPLGPQADQGEIPASSVDNSHTPPTGSHPAGSKGPRSWRDSSPENILENVLENSSITRDFSNTDYSI